MKTITSKLINYMNPLRLQWLFSLPHFLHLNMTNILRLMASTCSFLERLHKNYRLNLYDLMLHFHCYYFLGYKKVDDPNNLLHQHTRLQNWKCGRHWSIRHVNIDAYPEYSSYYLILWVVGAGPVPQVIPKSKNILLEILLSLLYYC